jgi:hypothetical protein
VRVLGADPATADDLVQETFVVALRRADFDASAPGAVFTFLRTTARQLWLRNCRGTLTPRELAEADAVWDARCQDGTGDDHACALTADHLRQLPEDLTHLQVRGHDLTPGGLEALRRFAALRTLEIDTRRFSTNLFARESPDLSAACSDAVATALGSLCLTKLVYRGAVSLALLEAIAGQPEIAEVELHVDPRELEGTLGEVTRAPKLRRLALLDWNVPSGITPELLAPLRASRTLRVLELRTCEERGTPGLDAAAVRRARGDAIEVRLHRSDHAIKR